MKIKVKLDWPAPLPARATDGSAGYDLCVMDYQLLDINDKPAVVYRTGVHVEIPEGYVGLLFPRSSVWKKGQVMANCVGVIDSDYRGEITAVFRLNGGLPYRAGERFAQLVIVPCLTPELEEVRELSSTERGEGGFGSTGK